GSCGKASNPAVLRQPDGHRGEADDCGFRDQRRWLTAAPELKLVPRQIGVEPLRLLLANARARGAARRAPPRLAAPAPDAEADRQRRGGDRDRRHEIGAEV